MQKHSIVVNGRQFELSALTLGDLRRLEPALLGVEQKSTNGFGSMLALLPVIHASISKLHPEIAFEELEEMLDLSTFSEVLDRVLRVSGLKRDRSEALGEDQPAAE